MPTIVDVSPEATVLTSEEEEISLQVIEATVETSRYDEAATIELQGLADASRETIQDVTTPESSAALSINGTTVGSGMLTEFTVDGEGVVTVNTVGAVNQLAKSGVGKEFKSDPAQMVLSAIFEAAGFEAQSQGGGTIGRPGYALEMNSDADEQYHTSRVFTHTTCLSALEQICQERNWYWYVDAENIVHVVDELDPTEHDLQYVTETTAGLQSPPYRRVVVTGGRGTSSGAPTGGGSGGPDQGTAAEPDDGSASSGEDDDGRHLLSKTRVQGIAGTANPTYRYTDSSIHTPEVAENVARGIMEEFMRQRATGVITIVGDPTIRPLDVVQMPDSLGGEEYYVSDLVHELSNSDGFITKIGVGGLIDPAQIDAGNGTTTTADDDLPGPGSGPDDDGTDDGDDDDGDDDDGDGEGDSGSDDGSDDDSGGGPGPDGPLIIAP